MSNPCPLCGQSLPEAIDESELKARIQKLATPALADEKKKLQKEFEERLKTEREAAKRKAERQFEQELRAAKELTQQAVEQAQKEVEDRLSKEVAREVRRANTESEAKVKKVQDERAKERLRYEAESAKLQGKLDDLSRKLEKQTGEQLGAEAELDLFTELTHAFPKDKIERVGRGIKGADIVHEVMDGQKSAGRIVYESKNTSTWQNAFIVQARKYRTQYETPHVLIVTHVFPSKQKGLCVVNGIPVVDRHAAIALAAIIREGVIEIAKLRLSGKFQDEKSQELFEYIVGDKFCTRFREIAEAVTSLREQQQKERTWHENAWQAESKIHGQLESRHREIDAQIKTIVGGSAESKVPRFAVQPEKQPHPISVARHSVSTQP